MYIFCIGINYMRNRSKMYVAILVALLFGIIAVKMMSAKEGFDNKIGMYDYLAPPTDKKAFSWSDETLKKFTDKYNTIPKLENKMTTDLVKKALLFWISEPEALHFIENGVFPINLYVQNFINSKTNTVKYGISKGNPSRVNGVDITTDNLKELFSNRLIYNAYIKPIEEHLAPLSFQYFIGTLDPPSTYGSSGAPSDAPSSAKGGIKAFLPV